MAYTEIVTALGKLLDWLRSTANWLAVIILCAALLFAPHGWLLEVGPGDMTEKYRAWIALAALAAGAMLLSKAVMAGGSAIRSLGQYFACSLASKTWPRGTSRSSDDCRCGSRDD